MTRYDSGRNFVHPNLDDLTFWFKKSFLPNCSSKSTEFLSFSDNLIEMKLVLKFKKRINLCTPFTVSASDCHSDSE